MKLLGLHHITAMASDPRANFEFYTRVLGLRFVKKSVNQDDPGTYHLYYGDTTGSPGSALTFFPWPGLKRGRPGSGQAYATGFSISSQGLPFWQSRLKDLGIPTEAVMSRFNDQVLTTFDPDGLRLELVASDEADPRVPAVADDIPPEARIRGFHSSTLALSDARETTQVLTSTMGYRRVAEEGNRTRFTVADGGPGTYVDLLTDPKLPRGLNGAGTIHHVAFRTPDDKSQETAHAEVAASGLNISPIIDRAYFKSVYFREPGGILFEIATDQPGFAIDEPVETLGTKLGLPPHLEPYRPQIEAALPPLVIAP